MMLNCCWGEPGWVGQSWCSQCYRCHRDALGVINQDRAQLDTWGLLAS